LRRDCLEQAAVLVELQLRGGVVLEYIQSAAAMLEVYLGIDGPASVRGYAVRRVAGQNKEVGAVQCSAVVFALEGKCDEGGWMLDVVVVCIDE
jgi:hypothetical protein